MPTTSTCAAAGIDRLVTLGSPHSPPPQGVLDQTRGILTHVQQTCPGNFHQEVCAGSGLEVTLGLWFGFGRHYALVAPRAGVAISLPWPAG